MTDPTSDDSGCCAEGSCCGRCCGGCCGSGCGCCTSPHGKLWTLLAAFAGNLAATLSLCVACGWKFVGWRNGYDHSYHWGYSNDVHDYPKNQAIDGAYPVAPPMEESWTPYYSSQSTTGPVSVPYYVDLGGNVHDGRLLYENGFHKASAAFALTATVVGFGAAVSLWPLTCRPYRQVGRMVIAWLLLFCFISQCLVFLLYGSDFCQMNDGCELLGFGIVNIVTCILWLLSAIFVTRLKEPRPPTGSREAEQQAPDASVAVAIPAATAVVESTAVAQVQPASSTSTIVESDGTKVLTTRTETASGTIVRTTEKIYPDGKKEVVDVTTENV